MKTPLLLIVLGSLATGCARGPVTHPAASVDRVDPPSPVASLPPGAMEFSFSDDRTRPEVETPPSTRLPIGETAKPRHLLIGR